MTKPEAVKENIYKSKFIGILISGLNAIIEVGVEACKDYENDKTDTKKKEHLIYTKGFIDGFNSSIDKLIKTEVTRFLEGK